MLKFTIFLIVISSFFLISCTIQNPPLFPSSTQKITETPVPEASMSPVEQEAIVIENLATPEKTEIVDIGTVTLEDSILDVVNSESTENISGSVSSQK